ncbi:MAG: nucleotide exchange factor GrpE [Zoogloeaceae bacterium]|jgi:molecular chaperone GrpE|nr:nucleotide exchange factor GrpE [Zoogloeaceae bacterium]
MSQDNTSQTQVPADADPSKDEVTHAETVPAPEPSCADAAASDLVAQIAALEQKNAELQDNWLRAKAETENVRRRAQEEIAKAHKFGIEKFASELLTVKDSLEAALASEKQTADDLRGGVELTLKQLVAAFEKSALKEINPLGEKFDPHLHQAIQMIASDREANHIAQVLQKGYLLAERVLRPAMVLVSSGKPD